MRLAALTLFALTLAVGVATSSAAKGPGGGGSLSIENGRGTVQVTGKGVVVGRVDRGSLRIVDLTPADQWSPWVNGVPRGKVVWLKGHDISFRISAGRYRIVATGEGVSISARGTGVAVLDGDPDAVGDTGFYGVGDGAHVPLPLEATKAAFGTAEKSRPSAGSVKIQP